MDVGKYVNLCRFKLRVVILSKTVCSVFVHFLSKLKEGPIGLLSRFTVRFGFLRKKLIDSGRDVS